MQTHKRVLVIINFDSTHHKIRPPPVTLPRYLYTQRKKSINYCYLEGFAVS